MFKRRQKISLFSERLELRLPRNADYTQWASIRRAGSGFLSKWEPVRDAEYEGRRAFQNRAIWAERAAAEGKAFSFMLIRQDDQQLVGALTLDNVRHGPSQAASVGYWVGPEFARQGYMREALGAVVDHAFTRVNISRIEAACLPENKPSRALLEKSGFKYEGVAQSYLQIAGRWRTHVLYANLRRDRRGKTDAG